MIVTDTTWRLSGFGDEIDPDPRVQLALLADLGARHIEVRSAWGTNILDLTETQLTDLRSMITDAGFGVSAVASPIGKVDISKPIERELERLRTAISAARRLDTRYIRIFSFYRSDTETPEEIRDAVLRNMHLLARTAEDNDVVLIHENEKAIYGDTPGRVLDMIEGVGSEHLKVAWDSANFVQVGYSPVMDAYQLLRPHLEYVQIKDASSSTGEIVPAGRGDGQIRELVEALIADGYRGFVSLEPHLASAHQLGGFSGPAAFTEAGRAFREICDEASVRLV